MTRTKAKQSIERGLAYVNGTQCFKPAAVIKDTDLAELKKLPEYASFGGEKLAKALQDFDFSVQDMTCADIGASNGGFTSCLLLNGAKKVFAIDVGECALPPTGRAPPYTNNRRHRHRATYIPTNKEQSVR